MLSPELCARAEDHLHRINEEIAHFETESHADRSMAAEYLKHLRAHRDMWIKYLDC